MVPAEVEQPPTSTSSTNRFCGSRCTDISTTASPAPLISTEHVQVYAPPPRVYEVWSQLGGNSRFCCGGRCITGPPIDFKYNLCAWSFIVIPTTMFAVVCMPELARVSELLPIVTTLVFLSTVFSLLLTSCTDPGIIPRYNHQQAVDGLEEEVQRVTGVSSGMVKCDHHTAARVPSLAEHEDAGYRW
eukprot:CAMPEP_0178415294 /NCGR_PEP_ID=MMETSP0689_2-20121128/23478_1 /TAXON_ID=160604 /ORGANISM="Amphidinium massartii, Strain CS-259" /LENGTH=186 /DNA_ID=CAMNT_0020036611 /DNA_START=12 /DNA_END=569 /DNA_ORIENTATION=+